MSTFLPLFPVVLWSFYGGSIYSKTSFFFIFFCFNLKEHEVSIIVISTRLSVK